MPEDTPAKGGAKPPSHIVIHVNDSGHHFATRVNAPDAEAAGVAIASHHIGNRFVHVYPDKGEKEIEYDGETYPVNSLDEEP